jgi:hypothetical protein
MSDLLAKLQRFDADSYWAEDYLDAIWPLVAPWVTRPLAIEDLEALNHCMSVVSDLDATDNAPFAALWALRSTGALPPVEDLDGELTEWRDWIEEDYYDGESLALPAITRRDS